MKLLKYGVSTLLLSASLFATAAVDQKVIDFEKMRFLTNQGIALQKVVVEKKEKLPVDGWYGYLLKITADVPGRGVVSGNDLLFSNGQTVATELLDINDASSFKDIFEPKLTADYYNKKNLIAGNENAKNKVVVFSDPLCPACQQTVPGMIQKVNANPEDIALYYYHFPLLSLHPAALALSQAMVVAKEKGVKNVEMTMYLTNFSAYFNSRETNPATILAGFNKAYKTDITMEELQAVKVVEDVQSDMTMGEAMRIQGTPTIYVNGKNDKTRRLFGALGK